MTTQPSLEVRRLTTPEEVRDIVFSRAANEGWMPGALDHISYFAADESYFLAAEINGEPIGCGYFVKFNRNYVLAAGLVVDKQYRGKGYGIRIMKRGVSFIDKNFNLTGNALFHMLPFYALFGFKPQWHLQSFHIIAQEVSHCWAKRNDLKCVNVIPPSKELFPAIVDYDTHIHVYPRPSLFLEKWLFAPNGHCSVAVNSTGDVVGYGVVRTTLREEENGWRVGPLFADSSTIARALYQDLFIKAAVRSPKAVIAMDVSYGINLNPDTLSIVNELGGIPTTQMMRVYKYGIPPTMPLRKIFVMM